MEIIKTEPNGNCSRKNALSEMIMSLNGPENWLVTIEEKKTCRLDGRALWTIWTDEERGGKAEIMKKYSGTCGTVSRGPAHT